MKKTVVAVVGAGLLAVSMVGAASATQTLEPNPNAKSQGNCVGVFSSQVKHNGSVVREQAQSGQRAELVREARAANC